MPSIFIVGSTQSISFINDKKYFVRSAGKKYFGKIASTKCFAVLKVLGNIDLKEMLEKKGFAGSLVALIAGKANLESFTKFAEKCN